MKIWFDTEFIEDGKTIDLISIGMVREDGGVRIYDDQVVIGGRGQRQISPGWTEFPTDTGSAT